MSDSKALNIVSGADIEIGEAAASFSENMVELYRAAEPLKKKQMENDWVARLKALEKAFEAVNLTVADASATDSKSGSKEEKKTNTVTSQNIFFYVAAGRVTDAMKTMRDNMRRMGMVWSDAVEAYRAEQAEAQVKAEREQKKAAAAEAKASAVPSGLTIPKKVVRYAYGLVVSRYIKLSIPTDVVKIPVLSAAAASSSSASAASGASSSSSSSAKQT